jgi:L-threonylcarbamoyladenylate synthase
METECLAADDAGIARAAELLEAGELVAFPTETVYGLGGLASRSDAVRKIFAAKGRPADRPVIVHLADPLAAQGWAADLTEEGRLLAEHFWPGPLTLIVPRSPNVPDAVTGGRETVGLRVPSHRVALDLLAAVGDGVAAPSANRYGHISPTTADHVLADLDGRIAAVVDGGPCEVGIESTIVEVLPADGGGSASMSILRHGGVSVRAIESVLGRPITDGSGGTGEHARAPGMVLSHYAPTAPLAVVPAIEADAAPDGVIVIRMDSGESDQEFARALYARLRAADRQAPTEIWIVPPESGEMLPAILDRLTRAAHR